MECTDPSVTQTLPSIAWDHPAAAVVTNKRAEIAITAAPRDAMPGHRLDGATARDASKSLERRDSKRLR
jgi:hypothetical protein